MSILDFKATREEWLERVSAGSVNSMEAYKFGIKKWDEFLDSIHHTDEATLAELKENQNTPEAYLFLNRYVTFLIKQRFSRTGINLKFTALRSWCAANGIMLHSEYIKQFVKFPKQLRELKPPLTPEIIRDIILNSPKTVKIVLLVLLSSGMRISEVLQLEVRDIKQDTTPIEIKVRAGITKTREERTAYISKECWELLRPMLADKEPSDLIFLQNKFTFIIFNEFENRFGEVRKRLGYVEKYEDGRRYHVNIHAFRANFMTQATKVLDGDTAHALLGHRKYLDVYFRLSQKEKAELYHTLEPYLTVSDEARQRGIIDEKDKQIQELQKMKLRIEKLEAEKRRKKDLD